MFIHKLELKNFKRFTDLTLDLGQKNYKLVLLIGGNGSGKSCVFDAFEYYSKNSKFFPTELAIQDDMASLDYDAYYQKEIGARHHVEIEVRDAKTVTNAAAFYGRSSLRQTPRLTRTQLGQKRVDFKSDSDRPLFYIDKDARFENDLEKVVGQILDDVFKTNRPTEEIKANYIDPINAALCRIFGNNPITTPLLTMLNPPLDGKVAGIFFKKGDSTVHYDLLSAGEKEVFNILINLLSRCELYQDTVYFFDEIDLHLNTRLQFNLLKEITENWIPSDCQFWTASHSLGFIEYAMQSADACIIDLDDLNFDVPQTLFPRSKQKLDVYDIAIPQDMIFKILKDKRIVLCENQNDKYYNLVDIQNTIFVGVRDSQALFIKLKRDPTYFGLRDRDFLGKGEIEELEKRFPSYHILRYYNFENYLFHPENIAEVNPTGFDKAAYIRELVRQKNERRDYIIADFKRARDTYEELKEDKLKDENAPKEIIEALKSDELEKFYPFFDMKKQFNKQTLATLNLDKQALCRTNWFESEIRNLLKG